LSFIGPATGLLLSAQVQKAAFALVQTEAGSSPTEPGGDPEATIGIEARAGLALRVDTLRSSLSARGSPRIYYQSPNVGDLERPLLLGQGDATWSYRIRPQLDWLTNATISYGEVDYLNAGVVLDTPAQNLPEPVLTMLSVRARSGFNYQITNRYSLEGAIVGDHTGYPDSAEDSLHDSTGGGIEIASLYALSLRDTMVFPLLGRYDVVSDSPDWLTVAAGIGYRRLLDARTRFDVGAGVAAAKPEGGDTQFFPRGALMLERRLIEAQSSTLTNNVSLNLDARLDPTLGEVRSTLALDIGLTGSVREKFTQRLSVQASTPAFDSEDEDDAQPEATTLSANGAVGYRVSDGFLLETGVRYSTRGTDFGTSDADFGDRQIFWFLGFRAAVNLGPSDTSPAWAL
jgi:hypothetical protein